jgi:hypothetical protein
VRVLVAVATVVAVAGLIAGPSLARFGRRAGLVAMAAVAIALLGGPAAYALQTISTTHTGSIPSAGPTVAGASGGPGGGFGFAGRAGGGTGGGQGLFGPGSSGSGAPPAQSGSARPSGFPQGEAPAGGLAGGPPGAGTGLRGGLGAGGGGATVNGALVKALESNASSYRWVAATMGSTNAASYELASGGEPVMAIGGFNNNGGLLSLAQFIRYVKAGDIHYYIASGGAGGGPNGGTSSSTTDEISSWVASHYSAETIGGVTVYDLGR